MDDPAAVEFFRKPVRPNPIADNPKPFVSLYPLVSDLYTNSPFHGRPFPKSGGCLYLF